MEVFLSYGHPEHEICVLRIVDALRQRGHKPWFDLEKLDTGDWREKLAEGIGRSDAVVSCLSRHAVREPGVCLDELSIAVGVRGGNIQTILLEPEQVVEPPASLCHLQWLDMSQWREKLSAGEAVFRPWFDAHMARLFEVIESPESRSFVGQITAIRKKLFVNYDSSRQRELLSRRFVGRRWLAEQVDGWLDDPAGRRLCVLTGPPGVGKSAFAANYIHRNPRVAAGLFCSYDRPLYNDARTVLMTLAYLLACRLPDYRVALSGILERETRLGQMNVPELFERLLADPLGNLTIDGGHETLCIVVDGLDECGDTERNALAETMGVYAPRLPRWLRVLVLARDVSAVREPRRSLQNPLRLVYNALFMCAVQMFVRLQETPPPSLCGAAAASLFSAIQNITFNGNLLWAASQPPEVQAQIALLAFLASGWAVCSGGGTMSWSEAHRTPCGWAPTSGAGREPPHHLHPDGAAAERRGGLPDVPRGDGRRSGSAFFPSAINTLSIS